MIADCRKGKIKRILVKSISRFCRNTLDCIKSVRELSALGVSVLFEKEGIDTATLSNELFLAAMSDFAQSESFSIASNLRKGIRMRMAQGDYVPPSTPYGYRIVNKTFVVQEDEAEIVKQIYSQYLSGIGPEKISLTMNKNNTGNRQNWCTNAIRYILTNERYIGDLLLQKTYTSDVLPFSQHKNKGELDQYMIYNNHTAIIDKEVYDRVQKRFEQRKIEHDKRKIDTHPFKGKIRCANCSSVFKLKTSSNKRYWSCRRHDKNADLCDSPVISEYDLEQVFMRCRLKLSIHKKQILNTMLEQMQSLKRSLSINHPQAKLIVSKILELNEQSAVYAGLAAKDIISNTDYLEKKSANDDEIQRLQTEKAKLNDFSSLDAKIEGTRFLIECVDDDATPYNEFSAELFTQVVKNISVSTNGIAEIHLINGLKLSENIFKNIAATTP